MQKAASNVEGYLAKKWFDNVKENKINDEVLCIKGMVQSEVSELLKKELENFSKISYLTKVRSYHQKNIIYCTSDARIEYNKQLFDKRKFLFLSRINLLDMNKNISIIEITQKDRYLYYLEKVNTLDLVQNKIYLKNFLENRIKQLNFIIARASKDLLLNGINYQFENYDKQYNSDIDILEEHHILPSRLAVLLYRVSTLNLQASTTEAGRFFHEELGTRSKVYNDKHIGNEYYLSSLIGRNFKAYNLKDNDSEKKIRKEIANNLINFEEYEFNNEMISEITKLSTNEIEAIRRH
jgi:hypothetical protein